MRTDQKGMTLVEILIVVSILGMLTAMTGAAIRHALRQRENLQAANRLRTAVSAFQLYASEQGAYPPDRTPAITPPEMSAYYFPYHKIDDWWEEATPLGGQWDWDNGYHYDFSVSIHAPDCSIKQLEMFDAMIDDGDLYAGEFRRHGNHYHFIIEE